MMPTVLYIYCLIAALIPNVALAVTEPMSAWARVANVLLPLGIYMLLLSWSRRIGRSVWCFFPVLFIAAFQIVLLKLYGKSVIAVDMFLNLVTTNPGEAGELLGSLTLIVAVDVVVFLPLLLWGARAWTKHEEITRGWQRKTLRAGGVATAGGIICVIAAYICSPHRYRIEDHLYPLNAFYNLALAIERSSETAIYHTTSASFSPQARSTRDPEEEEMVILVVGETSRAENWQLCGYGRRTNPLLSNIDGLVTFDRVLSQSNTTHKAVPMLLSDLTAETFGDSIATRKSIITAFREAGFGTTYISNQGRNHSYIDFFGNEADETSFLRDSLTATELLHPITDLTLLPHLAERLSRVSGKKELIVLHTYGSHFSYYDRYPDNCRHFTPDTYTRSAVEMKTPLLNAYDNSILATDLLLDSVISMVDHRGIAAAVIFASDHGEDIYDDRRHRFLHASPTPTFHQINVPLLVWTSAIFRERHPEMYAALLANRHKRIASSVSFYHTALQLAGIEARTFDPTLSLASDLFKERPRLYLTDHNHAVPLAESGFEKYDMELLEIFDR